MKLQQEHAAAEIRVFLMADTVTAALPGQTTPQGYYNIERMLKAVVGKQGHMKACGTCPAARGLDRLGLIEGIEVSTMSQLAQWVMDSDKVLTF